jgi:hypothetical protein
MSRTAKRTIGASANGRLEEAPAKGISNQALLVGQMGQAAECFTRMDERLAHIGAEPAEIKAILPHQQPILEALPEAVR